MYFSKETLDLKLKEIILNFFLNGSRFGPLPLFFSNSVWWVSLF
jgi:hypothetical protein